MIRSTAPRLFGAVALALMAAAVGAAGSTASDRAVYIVALDDPPLAAHAAALAHAPGIGAAAEKQAVRAAMRSTDAEDYLHRLDAARAHVLALASQRFGRSLAPRMIYRHAANGMSLALSEDEAQRIAGLPGVAAVRRERVLRVHTDAGPQWIGADALWNGAIGGIAATKGEGVVVGIVDTGINALHPSFAATGGDGYTATNPRGHFYGLCATGQAQCNAKLIGVYDFSNEGTQGGDSVGHGSHTAGIAVGNAQTNALHGNTVSLPRNVSGVAPHANLITYKGCNSKPIGDASDGTCAESWLVAAIDQATADQVDVINYSIGGTASDPYALLDDPTTDAYAMFQARAAGIVVAVSAGNDGPGPGTVSEPGNVPWVLAAANASHNRRFVNSIGAFSGAANAPGTLTGQGYTAGYGPAKIVYAGNFGNALCGIGDTQGTTPNGASNPFAANTFHGEIVICDRGTYARVEKGYNVKAAGAGGYILANTASDGESIVSDDHYLPAVHLGYVEGQALKTWVATAGTHDGTIAGVTAALDPSFGDVLDASSSRGPYGFSGGGVLKPDLTAPGDNILSAAGSGNGLALLSGTSMASPHVAGSAALVLAVHPTWTPAQVESTLVATALADVRKQDGVTPASPIDAGAGRVQPALAVQAGLYLPLANADFFAGSGGPGNAQAHGDLKKINRPGIESESCFQHCSFARTVADISGGGTWQVSTTATTGAAITVVPNQFSLAAGASQPLAITVDVSDPRLPGNWVSGRIVLHKTGGGHAAADIALAVAVYASPGQTQPFRSIAAPAPGGNATFQVSGLVGLPQATFTTTSLAPATQQDLSLGVDPAPGNLYDAFPGTGKQFVLVPNVFQQGVDTAAYGRAFIVEIAASNAQQTHLYAGIDSNGDGLPTQDEQACHAVATFGSTSVARCVVDLRGAGAVNVWALVDIPTGTAGVSNSVRLSYGIPTVNVAVPITLVSQQLHVVGPGHVDAGAGFPLRVFWGPAAQDDNAAPLAAGTYYGAVMVDGVRGLAPAELGQSALIPLSIVSAGGVDAADALHPGVMRTVILSGTQPSLQHTFIDVPPGATTLSFDTAFASGATSAVTFSAVRTDFPPASVSAAIAPAPNAAPALGWTIDAVTQSKHVAIPATPGRWYLTAQYANSIATSVTIAPQLAYGAGAPVLTPGNYFDPQRSGHGIFLSRAGGQQVADWYTYLEDGTPTWYVAQNLAPAANAGVWTSTLYRASWDGNAATPTAVGDVTLTALSTDHAMFSWHLYGASGSEAFELLAAPDCVNAGGNVDLNGEWYPPAQGGIGFDALVIPSQQFDAFYLYDATGNPAWVVGGAGPFAAASTVPMLQSTGFCPLCDYRALTTQSAGTLDVTYANGGSGQIGAAITLNAPLVGSWNVNQPIARLTGSTTCTP